MRYAGHVPAHDQHRVDDQADVGPVPVELHRHRVDQVRHVVGDDVDDGARGGQRAADPGGRLGRADADDRTALRAGRAERGVPGGRLGQPVRAGRDQVLKRHPPVVRGQEGEPVIGRAESSATRPATLATWPGVRPECGRLGQQRRPRVVPDVVR